MSIVFDFQGEIITGETPLELIEQMKNLAYDSEQFLTTDSYIEWLATNLWRFHGIGINAVGDTLENRCNSLIKQLKDKQVLKPMKQ